MKDGVPAQFSDFHSGDRLSATIVTTHPPKVMTQQQVNATLAKAAPASGAVGGTRRVSVAFVVGLGLGGTRRVAVDVGLGRGSSRAGQRSCRRRRATGRCSRSPASCRSRPA